MYGGLLLYLLPSRILACIDREENVVDRFFFFLCALTFIYIGKLVALVVGPDLRKHTKRTVFVALLQTGFERCGHVAASALHVRRISSRPVR